MAERPTPEAVFKRLVEHRPTVFYGVPTLYAACWPRPTCRRATQVALRMCASAGEALPREIGERFTRALRLPTSSTASARPRCCTSSCPTARRRALRHHRQAGARLRGRAARRDGRPVADGEIGDLYIRGPSAALMYWGNREKTPRDVPGRLDQERRQVRRATPTATTPTPAAATTC